MATRKSPARRRRAAPRGRRTTRTPARKAARRAKSPRKPPKARQVAARKARPRRQPSRRSTRRPPAGPPASPRPTGLERTRRQLPDDERLSTGPDAGEARLLSSAKAGHDELKTMLARHTETSPKLTAGDIDAKWEDAYAVGDEAPGGDNPTPGQDRVDDIGRALGIQYKDDQELQGGDEVAKRDKHRWELDPASSDDWPHKE